MFRRKNTPPSTRVSTLHLDTSAATHFSFIPHPHWRCTQMVCSRAVYMARHRAQEPECSLSPITQTDPPLMMPTSQRRPVRSSHKQSGQQDLVYRRHLTEFNFHIHNLLLSSLSPDGARSHTHEDHGTSSTWFVRRHRRDRGCRGEDA